MKELILIGGAPLTGKSSLAKEMNSNSNVISTDQVRLLMKQLVNIDQFPNLFYDELTADEVYTKYKAEEIYNKEITQGKDIQKFLKLILTNFEGLSKIIIEGIAIDPEFVNELKNENNFIIKQFFIYDDNKERIKERILKRGLWNEPRNYDEKYLPIEIEWVNLYNQWYLEECKKYEYKIIRVDDITDDLIKSYYC